MSRVEEYVGVCAIKAANVYGEGQHLYSMWFTDVPIVRCRDCKQHYLRLEFIPTEDDDEISEMKEKCKRTNLETKPDGFCAWGEREDE